MLCPIILNDPTLWRSQWGSNKRLHQFPLPDNARSLQKYPNSVGIEFPLRFPQRIQGQLQHQQSSLKVSNNRGQKAIQSARIALPSGIKYRSMGFIPSTLLTTAIEHPSMIVYRIVMKNKSSDWIDYIELGFDSISLNFFKNVSNCPSRWKQCGFKFKTVLFENHE